MCVINHTYRFIYIHVPKNAGTSLTTYLAAFSTYRDQEIGGTPMGQALEPYYGRRYGLTKHTPADRLRRVIGQETFDRYHVFATTRDPYERAVSTWRFLRRWELWHDMPAFGAYVDAFGRSDDVNEFLASPFFETDGPDDIFKPQIHWISDWKTGDLLTDSLLRVDELGTALSNLCTRLHLPVDAVDFQLPRANRSPGSETSILDSRSERIIEKRYERDFERLGYERRGGRAGGSKRASRWRALRFRDRP